MRYEFWRLFGVILFSVMIGLTVGQVFLCVAIGLLVCLVRQYRELSRILVWLQKRHDGGNTFQPGLINEIYREIGFLKARNRLRKRRLSGYLKRFQEATAALPDAVIVLGENDEIQWANRNAMKYIGIHWPKDSGMRLSNLVRHPGLIGYLESVEARAGKGVQIPSPINNRLVLEVRIAPWSDEQQKLLVARDITDIYRTNRMRKDFIANASHELKTPLTVISGYLEDFIDDRLCPADWKDHLRQMRAQALRMQNLIQDLLQLSSLETGDRHGAKTLIPVPDMLSTVVSEARSLQGFNHHQITMDVDESLQLMGYPQELYSIFSNLVFNAIQYTPEGGKIKIIWSEVDNKACFSVEDNGPGIEQKHLPRLTERFYRVDKSRSSEKGGTGLGLAIVKHALARYDGQLTIDSDLGRGSVFLCRFPESFIARTDTVIKKTLLV